VFADTLGSVDEVISPRFFIVSTQGVWTTHFINIIFYYYQQKPEK